MKGKIKILIIEDDDGIRELLTDYLKMEGFTVVSVLSIEDAENYLELMRIDLIISDIILPGKNGLQFLEEIESSKKFENIPVILISARSSLNDIRAGMSLGADDYLTKPFKIDDLLNSIRIRLKKKTFSMDNIQDSDENSILNKYNIRRDTILFIEASNQYSIFNLSDGSKITMSRSLKYWEDNLRNEDFIRINRSVIVSKSKISYYDYSCSNAVRIKLEGVHELFSVSRRRKKELLHVMRTLRIEKNGGV